jgi:hypothetical protein
LFIAKHYAAAQSASATTRTVMATPPSTIVSKQQ